MNLGGIGGGVGVGVAGAAAMKPSPFTVSQWQELEHQALIYKYMVAGLPVPPDLVLPIQKSFDSISHRYFSHPTAVGYCSFYGKKVDPEPGRCRRTDGKKWRCSKDAYPDSKYCERHMHRGRNRSRKPVESQQTPSSLAVSGTNSSNNNSASGSFQNLPLNAYSSSLQNTASATNQSHYNLDAIPYGIPSKDYRYAQTLKPEIGEHSFFSEAGSGSNRGGGLQIESQLDNSWHGVSSFTITKSSDNSSILQNDYPQHSFFSGKQQQGGGQPLRPFLEEWSKNRDSWSSLEEDRSNPTSFSTTRLSISTPIASSDLSTPSSQSPHDN